MKIIIKLAVFTVLLGFIASIYLGASIYRFGWGIKPQKSDCIIVLGCKVKGVEPSPFLKGRLDEGIRLFKEGYGRYIIVSGGKGPGEDITEAEAMGRYLVEKGVAEESIILEDKSKSTLENLKNSKVIMNEKGLRDAVIVSNKFHLKRVSNTVTRLDMAASYSGVFIKEYKLNEVSSFVREIPALIKYFILG